MLVSIHVLNLSGRCPAPRSSPTFAELSEASAEAVEPVSYPVVLLKTSTDLAGSRGSTIHDLGHADAFSGTTDTGKTNVVDFVDDDAASTIHNKSRGISPRDLVRKLRLNNIGITSHPTVVLRPFGLKQCGSLHNLHDGGAPSLTDEESSGSSSHSSKISRAEDDSTRKTSFNSQFSLLSKESMKRRNSRRNPWTRSSPEGAGLGTIDESSMDVIQPTILTVEKAAAAKVFLETHFNELLKAHTPRDVRRQCLESQLYYSPHLGPDQKDAIRHSFFEQETCHQRETRVLQAHSLAAGYGTGGSPYVNKYESLKVLGKGSFGVVRLVREKASPEYAVPRQVFAMKVIRKSDMLRSSQEGHLRAERDFLVASEGANW